MNRRELLGTGGLLPALLAIYPAEKFLADFKREGGTLDLRPQEPIQQIPTYDPVAVLEAMQKLNLGLGLIYSSRSDADKRWIADFAMPAVMSKHPDFPSAVRWLHAQAAAADPTFAQQFPVPE